MRIRISQDILCEFAYNFIGDNMKLFCERLKMLRLENKYSTVYVGKKLNVSSSTVLRWESGEITPSIDHLSDICKLFGVSADYLMFQIYYL